MPMVVIQQKQKVYLPQKKRKPVGEKRNPATNNLKDRLKYVEPSVNVRVYESDFYERFKYAKRQTNITSNPKFVKLLLDMYYKMTGQDNLTNDDIKKLLEKK